LFTITEGRENVSLVERNLQFLGAKFNSIRRGGRYVPRDCKPAGRTAIIVPFRDRDSHLKLFLYNVIPKLQRQKLDFTILIIEQVTTYLFYCSLKIYRAPPSGALVRIDGHEILDHWLVWVSASQWRSDYRCWPRNLRPLASVG